MRSLPIRRFAAQLLLFAGALASPSQPATDRAGWDVVAARDDAAEEAREEAEERREKAEEERENAEEERQEAAEERLEDEEDRREEEREAAEDQVESAAGYTVDVTCTPTYDAAGAECAVTGVAPEGGKKITSLVVPDDAVCARVTGGEFDRVSPDRQTNVSGYKSRGKDAAVTLVFDGAVAPGGATTYWLTAANGIVPATGPGFVCDEPAAEAPAALPATTADIPPATPPATPEPIPAPASTGTVTVSAYACPEGAAASGDYDWYGACDVGGDHHYVLAPVDSDDAADLRAADTAKTGEATFSGLPPGLYDLDDVNANWCHAESDAVNAEGDVMVEAGVETTVWLFYCPVGGGR